MKRFIIFTFPLVTLLPFYSMGQSWAWTRQAVGGNGNNYANGLCVDKDDNVYITGRVKNTGIFSDGVTTLTMNAYGDRDAYIAKYTDAGILKWAHHYGGVLSDYGYAIDDDSLGNTFLTGHFTSAGTFGPYNLTTFGSSDIFLAKHDSIGNILWVKKFGGTTAETSLGISVHGEYVYVTGLFTGTAVFDDDTLVSAGGDDIFIGKFDLDGNVIWVKRFGSALDDNGIGCAADNLGNIYVTGTFTGTVVFGSTTLISVSPSVSDILILKMDAGGNVVWANNKGSGSAEFGQSITLDKWGNVLVTGNWAQTNIITLKYDSTGNFVWQLIQGSSGFDVGNAIVADSLGDMYITGYFSGTMIVGSDTLLCGGTDNFYVEKISANGTPLWILNAGGNSSEHSFSIDINSQNELLVGGAFMGTGNYQGVTYTNPGGTYDALLGKLIQPVTADVIASSNSICVGDSIQFSAATTGFPLNYQWNIAGATVTGTSTQLNAVYNSPGTYSAQLIVNHGLLEADTMLIPLITVSAPIANNISASDTMLCSYEAALLNIDSSFSEALWSTGDTTAMITTNSPGLYSVMITDTLGCVMTDEINISFLPNPNINIGSDTSVCFGNNCVLNAGNGFVSYFWSDSSTAQSLSPVTTGEYWVEITDTSGCVFSDSVNISFSNPLTPQLGTDTTVCPGEALTLSPGIFYEYAWNSGDTTSSVQATTNGWYAVTVQDSLQCSATDSIWIDYFNLQILSVGPDTNLCNTPYVISTNFIYNNYMWSDFSTGSTLSVNTPGTYWVEVTDANNCIQSDSLYVDICDAIDNTQTAADIIFPNPVEGNGALTIKTNAAGACDIEIYNGLGQLLTVFPNLVFVQAQTVIRLPNMQRGVYTLVIRNGIMPHVHNLIVK